MLAEAADPFFPLSSLEGKRAAINFTFVRHSGARVTGFC